MKKVLLTLIVSLAFCGSVFSHESHWSDFDYHDYQTHADLMAFVSIDNNMISLTDNYADFEVGAFVGDECRGHAFLKYLGYLYPMTNLLPIYYTPGATNDVVSFKMFDHINNVEYTLCTSSEPVLTGNDYSYSYIMNPITLSFTTPTFTKDIIGYTPGSRDHYYLLASPIGEVKPNNVTNMLEDEFDLYWFNQEDDEWMNYKVESFNLIPGKGYLYANSQNTTLTFTGCAYGGSGIVTLTKNEGSQFEGWNLVGNPFGKTAYITKPFFTMNEDGSEIIASQSNSIGVMEGVFVVAESDGELLTFSSDSQRNFNGQIVLNVTRNYGATIDRAIIRFGENSTLPKFMLNQDNTKIYIPQEGHDYAMIHGTNTGELSVNFRAAQNGTYTLSVNVEDVDVTYLHLFDNLTGDDINLLQTPNYSFTASTSDDDNRFKLVYTTGAHTMFSYYNNGNWIINNEGNATFQVVDINGRIISSEEINGGFTKHIEAAPGVYMFRLIKGENVQIQNVIVK